MVSDSSTFTKNNRETGLEVQQVCLACNIGVKLLLKSQW